jgi:hypothetical protein
MKTILFCVFLLIGIPLFGQTDSSRHFDPKNYVDYIGDKDTLEPFFWNGLINRCEIPTPLFSSLDSVNSDMLVVVVYMPVVFKENGKVNRKEEKKTIQNFKGGKWEMYFFGYDLLNENLEIYTCEGFVDKQPIQKIKRRSSKIQIHTEDYRSKNKYTFYINGDTRFIGNLYNKQTDTTEIYFTREPEYIQIFK